VQTVDAPPAPLRPGAARPLRRTPSARGQHEADTRPTRGGGRSREDAKWMRACTKMQGVRGAGSGQQGVRRSFGCLPTMSQSSASSAAEAAAGRGPIRSRTTLSLADRMGAAPSVRSSRHSNGARPAPLPPIPLPMPLPALPPPPPPPLPLLTAAPLAWPCRPAPPPPTATTASSKSRTPAPRHPAPAPVAALPARPAASPTTAAPALNAAGSGPPVRTTTWVADIVTTSPSLRPVGPPSRDSTTQSPTEKSRSSSDRCGLHVHRTKVDR
jgi:hypothetical protein